MNNATNTTSTTARIHPLMAGAAISATVLCLVGAASIAGILPNSRATNAPAAPADLAATNLASPLAAPVAPQALAPAAFRSQRQWPPPWWRKPRQRPSYINAWCTTWRKRAPPAATTTTPTATLPIVNRYASSSLRRHLPSPTMWVSAPAPSSAA